jgi:protein-S-isoprenylcysteine O-methyltransferase Ste14
MCHSTRPRRRPTIAALPTIGDLVVAALFLAFARSSVQAWAAHGDLAAALLALQELLIGVLALCRRRARPTPANQPVRAAALAWLGTLLPLALRPAAPAVALLDQHVGLALQLWGGLVMGGATLALGRSFGIVPANRGIRTRGPYRVVRHPIYAGYLLLLGGFVLAHPSPMNAAVLVAWAVVQARRALVEERLLAQDAAYQVYQRRVRYRLMPGVW